MALLGHSSPIKQVLSEEGLVRKLTGARVADHPEGDKISYAIFCSNMQGILKIMERYC